MIWRRGVGMSKKYEPIVEAAKAAGKEVVRPAYEDVV